MFEVVITALRILCFLIMIKEHIVLNSCKSVDINIRIGMSTKMFLIELQICSCVKTIHLILYWSNQHSNSRNSASKCFFFFLMILHQYKNPLSFLHTSSSSLLLYSMRFGFTGIRSLSQKSGCWQRRSISSRDLRRQRKPWRSWGASVRAQSVSPGRPSVGLGALIGLFKRLHIDVKDSNEYHKMVKIWYKVIKDGIW